MASDGPSIDDIYLPTSSLTDEERDVRDRVRRFCDEEVRPVINDYKSGPSSPFEPSRLARLGICGRTLQGHGCPGLSPLAAGLVAMELGRADGSVSTFHGVHSGLAMNAIGLLGSEEQKRRWLGPLARLEIVGAFALTEPDRGSDVVTETRRAAARRRLRHRRRQALDRQRDLRPWSSGPRHLRRRRRLRRGEGDAEASRPG